MSLSCLSSTAVPVKRVWCGLSRLSARRGQSAVAELPVNLLALFHPMDRGPGIRTRERSGAEVGDLDAACGLYSVVRARLVPAGDAQHHQHLG